MNYGPWKSTAWTNRKSDPWIFISIRLCRRKANAYSHSISMGTQNERSFYTVPSDSSYIVLSGFMPKKDNRCSNHNLSCVESIVQTSLHVGLRLAGIHKLVFGIDTRGILSSWFSSTCFYVYSTVPERSVLVHFFSTLVYKITTFRRERKKPSNKKKLFMGIIRDRRRMMRNIIFGTHHTENVSMNLCDSCNRHGICA